MRFVPYLLGLVLGLSGQIFTPYAAPVVSPFGAYNETSGPAISAPDRHEFGNILPTSTPPSSISDVDSAVLEKRENARNPPAYSIKAVQNDPNQMEIAAWKLEDLEEKGAYDALRPDQYYAIGSLWRGEKIGSGGFGTVYDGIWTPFTRPILTSRASPNSYPSQEELFPDDDASSDIQLPPDDEMSTGDGMSIGKEKPLGNELPSTGDEMFIYNDYGCAQDVAIKVEYREGYETAEWLRSVAAQGKNEHIVSVLAYGMLLGEEEEDDKAIIAYERLDQTAKEARRTDPLLDKFRLVKGLTLGLSEAFDLNIVHMDVKLENIMSYKRDKNTEWKVIDWDLRAKRQSMSTDYVGTRGYMAPEVYANRKKNTKPYIPERTMMFSFGMFLYNLWGIFHGKDGNPPLEITDAMKQIEQEHGKTWDESNPSWFWAALMAENLERGDVINLLPRGYKLDPFYKHRAGFLSGLLCQASGRFSFGDLKRGLNLLYPGMNLVPGSRDGYYINS